MMLMHANLRPTARPLPTMQEVLVHDAWNRLVTKQLAIDWHNNLDGVARIITRHIWRVT